MLTIEKSPSSDSPLYFSINDPQLQKTFPFARASGITFADVLAFTRMNKGPSSPRKCQRLLTHAKFIHFSKSNDHQYTSQSAETLQHGHQSAWWSYSFCPIKGLDKVMQLHPCSLMHISLACIHCTGPDVYPSNPLQTIKSLNNVPLDTLVTFTGPQITIMIKKCCFVSIRHSLRGSDESYQCYCRGSNPVQILSLHW